MKAEFTIVADEEFSLVREFFATALHDNFYENEGDAEHDGVEGPFATYRVTLERVESAND